MAANIRWVSDLGASVEAHLVAELSGVPVSGRSQYLVGLRLTTLVSLCLAGASTWWG